VFVFIHGIIFITIIYGAYTAWAIVNLQTWNISCTEDEFGARESDGTFEYIICSLVFLWVSMFSGCWVGLKVSSRYFSITCLYHAFPLAMIYSAHRSWYVTVVAILTDFVVLVMFAWGVYLASNREEKCSQVYSTQAPTYQVFFQATMGMWILHLIIVGIVVNRWGKARTIQDFRSSVERAGLSDLGAYLEDVETR